MKNKLNELFSYYNIVPNSIDIYISALTHASYKNEHSEDYIEDYDRLEFLGDSILDLVVAKLLYKAFPKERSGFLTKTRSYLVNGSALSEIGKNFDLLSFARLSNGEVNNNLDRNKLLEDMFEAFLGAVYLDQGYQKAEEIISTIFLPKIDSVDIKNAEIFSDPKSSLQEMLQSEGFDKITYQVASETGNAQNKHFIIEVVCNGIVLGTGDGSSKKVAEKQAALDALQRRIK